MTDAYQAAGAVIEQEEEVNVEEDQEVIVVDDEPATPSKKGRFTLSCAQENTMVPFIRENRAIYD